MSNATRVLLLLLVVAAAGAAQGQSTVTFAPTTGNVSNSSNALPVMNSSNIARSATIYLPSDLAGLPNGALITGIEFFKNDAFGPADINNVASRVHLKNSSKTAYTSADTDWFSSLIPGSTEVAGGNSTYMPRRSGWVPIGVFDTPFVYTGGSLEVLVEWSQWFGNPTPLGQPNGTFEWVRWTASTVRSLARNSSGGVTGTYPNPLLVNVAYQFQVPHLRVTYVDQDGGVLQVQDTPKGKSRPAGTNDIPVLHLSAAARGGAQTLSSLSVTKTGTLADSDIAAVTLWHDANVNGRVDGGDTNLASGTFSGGTANIGGIGLNIPANESRPLILAASLVGSPTGTGSFQLGLSSTAATFTSGPNLTTGSATSNIFSLFAKASSLPYTEGFDSAAGLNSNIIVVDEQQPVPYSNTGTAGGTPNYPLAVGPSVPVTIETSVSGNGPQAGAGFAAASYTATVSFAAIDIHFDLSAYTTADWLELSFWWNNVNLAFNSPSFASQGVFLSTDGGANWHAVLHIFQAGATSTWQQEVIAITPIMQALSLSYTNDIVIRIQPTSLASGSFFLLDSLRLEEPAPRVDIAPGMIGGGVPSAKPQQLVGAFDFTAISSGATVDDLTLGMTGTAAFTDVTDVELFLDDGDGVFSPSVDTPVGSVVASLNASGEAVYSGPSLFTVAQGQRRTLWVSAEINAAVAQGSTVGFEIDSASSVNTTPTANAGFPVSAGTTRAVGYATALPFDEDFGPVNGVFPDNALPVTGPGAFPSATNAGAAVTSFQSTNAARLQVDIAFANYTTIGQALGVDYPNGDAAGALDFFFDLSALSTATHDVELGFRWMHRFDEDSDEDGVFLSVDGGATWLACLYRFPMTTTTSAPTATWPDIAINLSSVLAANNVNFTSRMVIRFQGRGEDEMSTGGSAGTRDGLMIDDVTLSETPARVEVSPNIGVVGTGVRPGQTGAVIGGFDLVPYTTDHPLTDVSVTKSGTLADNMLSNVQLWVDANGDSVLDTGVDSQLGTATTFASAVADFMGATPVTLTKSRGPVRVFVTADIDASATAGEDFALSIEADTDVTSTGGTTVGTFPAVCRVVTVITPGTTPYLQGFETLPVANLLTSSEAGWYPAASNTGSAVYLFKTTNDANVAVGGPSTTQAPHAGADMAGIDFAGAGGSSAAGAMDFYLDMSGFNAATDAVTFSFAWNSVSNQQQDGDHVLISVDGGHSWHSVYRIPVSSSIGVWTVHSTSLSSVLNTAGANFTEDTVVRIQSTGALQFNNDGLLIDSVEVRGEPRLRFETIGGSQITNGSIDLQGASPTGATQNISYRIRNVATAGASDLLLTGTPTIDIVTSINANVSVATAPGTTSIAAGADTTFALDITPIAAGSYVVEVVIDSNDPANPSFRYFITGSAIEPEIDVQRPAGTSIASGGTDAMGSIAAGINNPFNYIVVNGGSANLNLTGTPDTVQIGSQTNCTATVTLAPAITNLGPAAAAPFTISVNPGQGAFSFIVTIPNNDPDEGNYSFTVSGTGADTPEIDVEDSLGTPIASGSFYTLTGAKPGSTTQVTFTIANNGNADLNLVGTPAIELVNLVNCTVVVTTPPTTPVAVGSSTTFTLDVTPSSASFNFRVRILNDDANEGTYQYTVVGVGVVSKGGSSGDSGGCSTSSGRSIWYLLALLAIPGAIAVRRTRARHN